MKHPPYHLRSNKAVDRYLLVEVIKRLARAPDFDLSERTYYSLSGPFLEDLRLMSSNFPKMRLVSLERNPDTYKRQKRHRFRRRLVLRRDPADELMPGPTPAVVWLDFDRNEWSCFATFQGMLTRVADRSVVKVTLDAEPTSWGQSPEEQEKHLHANFRDLIPPGFHAERLRPGNFPLLMQDMLRIASQQACGSSKGRAFQILSSFVYSDKATMLTLTGAVCHETGTLEVRKALQEWKHANLAWGEPRRIKVPELSIAERLLLEKLLPTDDPRRLQEALGYLIDDTEEGSMEFLQQFADYHDYLPQFAKVLV
ncbi:MAG: hypothetical protein NTW87_10275 [Planctomycetota bacterium]|nr:hypothetical protein [Planctomycetota bacterium]